MLVGLSNRLCDNPLLKLQEPLAEVKCCICVQSGFSRSLQSAPRRIANADLKVRAELPTDQVRKNHTGEWHLREGQRWEGPASRAMEDQQQ